MVNQDRSGGTREPGYGAGGNPPAGAGAREPGHGADSEPPAGDGAARGGTATAGRPQGDEAPGFARRHRREIAVVAAVVVAFLIGFVWQFVRAQRVTGELERTRVELEFSRMEATLGAAAVAAQRGHHETGRELASRFFTSLEDRREHARVADPQQMRAIMAQRDAAITALSRASPDADEMMAQLLVRFRVGLHGPQHAIPLPGTDAPAPEP